MDRHRRIKADCHLTHSTLSLSLSRVHVLLIHCRWLFFLSLFLLVCYWLSLFRESEEMRRHSTYGRLFLFIYLFFMLSLLAGAEPRTLVGGGECNFDCYWYFCYSFSALSRVLGWLCVFFSVCICSEKNQLVVGEAGSHTSLNGVRYGIFLFELGRNWSCVEHTKEYFLLGVLSLFMVNWIHLLWFSKRWVLSVDD